MSLQAMNWIQKNLGIDVTGEWAQQVSLNVGGIIFLTRRATFQSLGDHPVFGPIVNGTAKRGEDGCFVIDRDGVTFRYVLNFLRSGSLLLPESFDEWDQLLDDAKFFQLQNLEKAILDRFEYQRSLFRRTLPQAVFVHWPISTNNESKIVIVPQLPALVVPEDGHEVSYQGELLRSIDELITTMLSAYGYVIQHWNEKEGKVFLTLDSA
ncbi:Potassium channel tetramerization-type BTB domain [Trypanosoma melophagium]|uniref:Potassium channel tetramerization-type BTB domain n=1 Tax=Trypanosoma melophagium TaxID=715481 RepID=UPI00351A2ED8|nr:Potassium channel tetramerization-type BTB domain [Trypanosoma melophagium]